MKKFMVLYMAPAAAFEKWMRESTPEKQKASMGEWMAWMGKHQKAIVDGGNPLGRTIRVDSRGAAQARNDIGGYSIIQAESHEAAAKMFDGTHPHLSMPGGWVEITEIIPIEGM
jgi:hypothetical protein